ncbi:ABC transporter-related protein [Pyrolobus fumarii 1A]|uniref:ABC transporter-related protein n=1 Tax=Pyrolobus fumarii (strain DSM 11204 / 1A) TaxID=694429 RepID=G0EC75_PYRF1|nr:ABC transporter ATP-binding protein [Pyrolobus fumarii]AEM39445.1 ABC transporter-related protein [Pyrolobus fumarii 1A]
MGGSRAPHKLVISKLTVALPGFKLGPVSLELSTGLHAILGPNGSGKTTLLRSIAGLVKPLNGRILLNGKPLSPPWRFVSANLATAPLGFGARIADYARVILYRLHGENWLERIRRVFAEFEVEWLIWRRWEELSDGQRSLAQTLVTLARGTPVILLDEPFAHLDPYWQCKLAMLLKRYSRSRIIVYTTHEFTTPLTSDTLTIMANGKVLSHGEPSTTLTPSILKRVYGVDFAIIPGVGLLPSCGADEIRAIP